ncbi:MAG: glycosyl hydrolase family 79 C-terminal domain-containing protein [Solirubrobacteraceae bacterium]
MTRSAIVAALIAAIAIGAIVMVAGRGPSSRPAPGSNPPASIAAGRIDGQVTLASGSPVAVPTSFLGVSTEYWTIPIWARQMTMLTRVLGMLGVDGAIRLRIGGDSADRVAWSPTKEQPEWVFELTPKGLRQVSTIVNLTHVHLILDLNLVTATPALAARWAKTALAGLPPGSVTAFEIGNEPDIYSRSSWLKITTGSGAPLLPQKITATSYANSFASYANALAKVAPGVPLLAPALAEPQKNFGWVTKLLNAPHPGLAGITAHRYPYSACSKPGTATYPTIARVLSEHATVSMGQTALKVERISDRAKLPLWLTEINSVTCGGTRGVSDTFATALWAPDALLELVRAGAESASVHVRAEAINMAFSLTKRGLVAKPLLYGMIVFARMLEPGAQLIRVHLSAPASLHLKAWAVKLPNGTINVLLLDKGSRSVRVRLRLPLAGAATIERLTAPKVSSTSGVTLAGQHLTAAATWAGARRTETVTPTGGTYVINVPRYSAALVTAQVRPGSLTAKGRRGA